MEHFLCGPTIFWNSTLDSNKLDLQDTKNPRKKIIQLFFWQIEIQKKTMEFGHANTPKHTKHRNFQTIIQLTPKRKPTHYGYPKFPTWTYHWKRTYHTRATTLMKAYIPARVWKIRSCHIVESFTSCHQSVASLSLWADTTICSIVRHQFSLFLVQKRSPRFCGFDSNPKKDERESKANLRERENKKGCKRGMRGVKGYVRSDTWHDAIYRSSGVITMTIKP